MINFDKLEKSLNHLKLQYDNYLNIESKTGLDDLDKQAIAESVVQRFETCYDTLWKTLKKYMEYVLGLPEVPNSPKPIFRTANENRLLNDKIQNWLNYAQARIDTAHDYSEEKLKVALEISGDFINDAYVLLEIMKANTEE